MSERLPQPDRIRIGRTIPRAREIRRLPPGTLLVGVHPLGGPHPLDWDEFRFYGPPSSRFDHQMEPPQTSPDRGIAYVAAKLRGAAAPLTTALAESHQASGTLTPIQLRSPTDLYVTVCESAAALRLLDLTGTWVTRAGGNGAISSGAHSRSREWSRVIYECHPSLDGIFYPSSIVPSGRCIALWERGAAAFPANPLASRSFADLEGPIRVATDTIGTFAV